MRALSLATVFAAASGFVVIIVAGRTLGDGWYDQFMAYWGLFFALAGLIDGLMHETTRATSSAAARPAAPTGANPWCFAALVGGAGAAVMALSSPLWVPLLVTDGTGAAALMALGLASYTFQAALSGILSGLKLWGRYAVLVALDSGVRLLLSLIAWLLGWGLAGFFLITVIGAASWLTVLRPHFRHVRVDAAPALFARRLGWAMAASGSSAALITGFPVLLKITSDTAPTLTGVSLSAVIAAVTLTRAPILVPVQRFQSALIVRFVDKRDAAALLLPLGLVLAVGLAGAVAAWAVGPWLIQLIMGPDFWAPGPLLAALTFASACTGSLMITGAAALASQQHTLYVLGWVAATLVAFAVLALPLALEIAVSAALVAGPAAGGILHVVALRRPVKLHP